MSPRLHRAIGRGALAVALAVLVVTRLTMRSVPVGLPVPSYGFPLPAFGWGGTSSLEWWLAVGPMLIDVGLACCLTVPVAWMLLSRASPRRALALGLVAFCGVTLLQLPLIIKVLMGELRWWYTEPQPIGCTSLWIGAPEASLDVQRQDDACVQALEQQRDAIDPPG